MIEQETALVGKVYVAGTRGYSNYEIAVKNGFVGTEEEWLEKITQDEADIVWENIREEIYDGKIEFEMTTDYDSDTEELTLSILPTEESE